MDDATSKIEAPASILFCLLANASAIMRYRTMLDSPPVAPKKYSLDIWTHHYTSIINLYLECELSPKEETFSACTSSYEATGRFTP